VRHGMAAGSVPNVALQDRDGDTNEDEDEGGRNLAVITPFGIFWEALCLGLG